VARVGVSQFAVDALGDVVYLELPQVGELVQAGDPCGEIESTKSVSTVFSPVSGRVTAVNSAALDKTEIVNGDPFGDGWLFELEPTGVPPELLTAEAYDRLTATA
jgi:glycine cleavage system H protein